MCQGNATPPGFGDAYLTVRQESLEATLCDLRISPDGAVQARAAYARWERRLTSLRLPFPVTVPRHPAADEKRPVRTAPRAPVGDGESVDLNELLSEARGTLGDLVGDRVELSVVPAAEWAGVAAAGRRLWTLLRALVGAACRRMPHGGTLTIETADTVLDAEFCSFHGQLRPGAYVMLALSDAGLPGPPGIGSANGREPFHRRVTGAARSGHGGLADAIARQIGGCICRHEGLGWGNTTEVFLPSAGKPHGSGRPGKPGDCPPRGFETVLVVNADREARAHTVRGLACLGYTVLAASDPAEAREVCGCFQGPVHLLICGPTCALTNAGDLLLVLRRHDPALRLLCLAADSGKALEHAESKRLDGAWLPARPTPEALAWKVREVLDQNRRFFVV